MNEEKTKLILRNFRHFKGNLYRLEGVAKGPVALNEMVVYRVCMASAGFWCAPTTMFFDTIKRGGMRMKRFEPIEE